MRGKAKKSGPKGGAKRHISNIKRSNQKRNKLVKQGKAKPLNSTPRYIPNQAKRAKLENTITPWQPSDQEVKGPLKPCFFYSGNFALLMVHFKSTVLSGQLKGQNFGIKPRKSGKNVLPLYQYCVSIFTSYRTF
jgi:hypothetical protein